MDDSRRRSHWMLRVLEWNDPKAKYPNLWADGMPSRVLAFDTIATRLRIGDLIAVYHPASTRHPDRSERYLGLSRVVGITRAGSRDRYWLELETAWRLAKPLASEPAPRRVFLSCDPGWPETDVARFRTVWDAARAEGFEPDDTDGEPPCPREAPGASEPDRPAPAPAPAPTPAPAPVSAPDGATERAAPPDTPRFAGIASNGDRRDPRDGTWLAVLAESGDGLRVVALEPTGRSGIQKQLGGAIAGTGAPAVTACAFPLGVPLDFAAVLVGGGFEEEGWWALARRFGKLAYPEYLVALDTFRAEHGEPLRVTDARAGAASPLSRGDLELALAAYHGIRMVSEERSRYAIRPFESAQAHPLIEVSAEVEWARLRTEAELASVDRVAAAIDALGRAEDLPVEIGGPHLGRCRGRRDALRAVLAARAAARAHRSGECDRSIDALAGDAVDRVRLEGWIYGT